MTFYKIRQILFTALVLTTTSVAYGYTDPPNANGATEFDWQQQWGSIHMNSYADGLNDPGSRATANGSVPCAAGTICRTVGTQAATPTGYLSGAAIANGIKYDIKNSLLNCMAQPMPTWAYNNVWDPWNGTYGVCISRYGLSWPSQYAGARNRNDASPTGFPHTLVYQPIWDTRANDTRSKDVERIVGCQQQISNSCVQDMHACKDVTNPSSPVLPPASEAGYLHPVTHVFTPQEVADLGGRGAELPSTYWYYKKIITAAVPANGDTPAVPAVTRDALSAVDPSGFIDALPGSAVEIPNKRNPHLARVKTYSIDNIVGNSRAIIVDPSDFFDLKHYVAGGKYDSGYNKFDPASGNVIVPESCPVAGLGSGYGGICDPTRGPTNAGCNLPIYEVGATTSFHSADGRNYDYANYVVAWSGYVKKWSVISVAQYLENIHGREDIYLDGNDINSNKIIMLTRADAYCENTERMSNPHATVAGNLPAPPDLPCVQYLQYQSVDNSNTTFAYVNLYNPSNFLTPRVNEFNTLTLFDMKQDGTPDMSSPVPGTGTNGLISRWHPSAGNFASFKDTGSKYKWYQGNRQVEGSALYKANFTGPQVFDPTTKARVSGPVYSSVRGPNGALVEMTGEYLGPNGTGGVGISLKAGTSTFIRAKQEFTLGGVAMDCGIVTVPPTATAKMFVPSNTNAELASFFNSYAASDPDLGLQVRQCNAGFMSKTAAAVSTGLPALSGTSTWVGAANCNALGNNRPSCNMTQMVTARRLCQLENGSAGPCSACGGVADPDSRTFFETAANGVTGQTIVINPARAAASERCYFAASCFNNSATGCPAAGTSGGHVFCFGPETKISMADGTEKAIKDVKAGEEVMSFNAKASSTIALNKAKIEATAITKKQNVIQINDFKITPLHKIVLATGRSVPAQDIKVGDKMLKANGLVETVTKIKTNLEPITVYNLVLAKGADGYIANGIRVMSYPIMKGMEINSGSLASKIMGIDISPTQASY